MLGTFQIYILYILKLFDSFCFVIFYLKLFYNINPSYFFFFLRDTLFTLRENSFEPEIIPKLVCILLLNMMLDQSLSWYRCFLKEMLLVRLHTSCHSYLLQEIPFLSELAIWCPLRRYVL